MMVCRASVLLRFLIICFVAWSDLLLPYLWAVCAFTASSFFLFFPFVITAKPEPFVTLCHFVPLLFSRHTHIHLFHTHTCHTHCIVLLAVLICIGTGEKINKGSTETAQCQKLCLKFLKELCIRFRLVFICRCNP